MKTVTAEAEMFKDKICIEINMYVHVIVCTEGSV